MRSVELEDAVVVVTGGASGIGRALAERFLAEGARAVVISDVSPHLHAVADEIGAHAVPCDVAVEAQVLALVDHVEAEHGPIDLFCANAGIGSNGGIDVDDDAWRHAIDVNLMSHVYAARALVPRMIARGGGHLLHTASAAGLLTSPGAVPYAVTKHGVVALAEWLAITHGPQGIGVSCLCPQGVSTPLVLDHPGELATEVVKVQGMIEPAAVADAVVAGLREGRFLILPHPEVRDYAINRATDHDRWIRGMQRLVGRVESGPVDEAGSAGR